MKSNIFDITARMKRETEKAILVDDGGGKEVWLPKGQIEIEFNRNGTVTISAPTWLLEEKGLI